MKRALLLIAAILLSGCGSADDAKPETRTFDLAGTALTIAKDNGDLAVRFGDDDTIRATRWFAGEPSDATWELADGTLRLATDCSGPFKSCAVRYEIVVPRATVLTVSGDNGAIGVDAPTADLTLQSTSGSISATGVASGNVKATSGNGTVDLAFTKAPATVDVTTDNGAVTVSVPPAGYRVTIKTDNGEVRNELPTDPASSHSVAVRTENGAVTLRTAS
ncbi:DUF4097 family beta strand repeat-containing protein [Dactylosporangium sp. NPDC000244]|uniref:DUF4097 family beta strand repeat-containing protein n=1 Tax=Dactylosporangium sp. NPDC000244 TaxID=3154365 RepID=UPI00332DC4DF